MMLSLHPYLTDVHKARHHHRIPANICVHSRTKHHVQCTEENVQYLDRDEEKPKNAANRSVMFIGGNTAL